MKAYGLSDLNKPGKTAFVCNKGGNGPSLSVCKGRKSQIFLEIYLCALKLDKIGVLNIIDTEYYLKKELIMKIKQMLIALSGLLVISSLSPRTAAAQWGLGASYEVRDEVPENGFGVRLERGILQKLPILDLGLRAHFSFFNEENQIDPQDPNQSTYSTEITDYDIGITGLAGVNIGFLKPYVGVGLGSNTVDVNYQDAPSGFSDNEDSKIFWNALIGAEVGAIPLLKPFVEYRYSDVGEDFFKNASDTETRQSQNGRVIFGVMLRF